MPDKHAILILEYENESKDSKDKLLIEAKNIQTRVLGNRTESTVELLETQHKFQEWMAAWQVRGLQKSIS